MITVFLLYRPEAADGDVSHGEDPFDGVEIYKAVEGKLSEEEEDKILDEVRQLPNYSNEWKVAIMKDSN